MNNKKENAKRTKPEREKVFSVATSVLLIIAVLFCGFVIYQIVTEGYVTIFGCSVFHVVSGSMEPEIPVGSLIISKVTDIHYIKEGDIVTFRSLDPIRQKKLEMITHRVIGVENIDGELSLRTRGDANTADDPRYVTSDNLVGRVIYTTSGDNIFKSLYELLTTSTGFFGIIVLPVVILTAVIMRDNIKRIKKEIENIKREVAKIQAQDSPADAVSNNETVATADETIHTIGSDADQDQAEQKEAEK